MPGSIPPGCDTFAASAPPQSWRKYAQGSGTSAASNLTTVVTPVTAVPPTLQPEIVVRVFEDGRVLETLEHLETTARACADASLWSLSDTEVADCLDLAHQIQQESTAILLHLVHAADTRGLADQHGCRSTAGWLRARLRLDPHTARTLTGQATALHRHPAVDQALSHGDIDLRQATAITDALDDLPDQIDTATTEQATTTLLHHARQLPAAPLRKLGARILEHVAPEIADRHDEAALTREERRAHRKRGFTLGLPVHGLVRVGGFLTTEDAAIVQAALDPLCTPQPGDLRSPAQQRADALVEICRLTLRTTELPDTGGEPPQVAVSVAFDPLTSTLGTGRFDTGQRLSATAVRRLACDAKILPVVLGAQGQVLDAGRTRRLATGPLRRALVLRDHGCAFPSCDRPPRWCDSHHVVHWADNGPTNLDNMVLVCARHHRLLHEGDWSVRLDADQLPEFIPPAHVDPTRTPRRNIFHPRT